MLIVRRGKNGIHQGRRCISRHVEGKPGRGLVLSL